MLIYPFPLMNVISQIKAYIFSVSMESRDVMLDYLSKTQKNALDQKQPQGSQLESLYLALWQNKLPQMKNTCKLKPVSLILTSDGLFMPHYVCLCLWPYCGLSTYASKKKKQAKMTSQDLNCSAKINKVSMLVYDFEFKENTTTYHKDEHQNRRVRKIKLRFMSRRHIFIILLTSAQKSYDPICLNYICPPLFLILCKFSFPCCLWLHCLCLGPPRTNDESKGNKTTNSNGKKVCTIPNKRVGQYSLDMLPICTCPCIVLVKKFKTANNCISLSPCIISFLTVKQLQTVLALISKDHLQLIWVEAHYLFPFTKNVWNQADYIVKIVYYNAVVLKPLHEVPPALHILYVSLCLTHPLQVLESPLMS